MSRLPEGNYAIILTPLTEDGELDLKGLSAELEYAVSRKAAGVVVLGSNGEGPYLTDQEKAVLVRHSAEAVKGRVALVAGCINVGTKSALEFSRMAKACGCDSVLATLHEYYQLDFAAVKRHYQSLAENAGLEITFYYVPDCSGLALKPEEIAELVSLPGVDSMKLSAINREYMDQTFQLCRGKNCRMFIGTGLVLFEAMKMDALGSFCPLNLIAGDDLNSLFQLCQAKKWEPAFEIQEKVRRGGTGLLSGMEVDYELAKTGFMSVFNAAYSSVIHHGQPAYQLLKEALRLKGLPITNQVRLPFPRVTPQQSEWIKKVLKDFGWLS